MVVVIALCGICFLPHLAHTRSVPIDLEEMIADRDHTKEVVTGRDLGAAWVASASCLYKWRNYHDFIEIADRTLVRAYAHYEPDNLKDAMTFFRSRVKGTSNWVARFELGLMAMAADRWEEARSCFAEVVEDAEVADNPFCHYYLARAMLKTGSPEAAMETYSLAQAKAAFDPPTKFRIDYRYCLDLYGAKRVEEALAPGGPIRDCLESDYPLERCFALYELLLRAWADGDDAEIESYRKQLGPLLKSFDYRRDSRFERRRYLEAENLLARVEAALAGDEVKRMILDEEACNYDWKEGNYKEVGRRLRPWVEKYPIETYFDWEKEMRFALRWSHIYYYAAESSAGRHATAETGLRKFIEYVPKSDAGGMPVGAHFWLALTLQRQQRYRESLAAYETALLLDAEDSTTEGASTPEGFLLPQIKGGKTTNRPKFVEFYDNVRKMVYYMDEQEAREQ